MSEAYLRPPTLGGSLRLDLNEAPWDAPAAFREAFLAFLGSRELRRYPPMDAAPVREAAASLYGWEPAGTLVGNGSNELLAAALAVLAQGKTVLAFSPSFSVYPWLVRRAGGKLRPFPLSPPLFAFPGQALLEAAAAAEVLLLCCPNNPTGGELPPSLWHRLLALGKPTIWDGAYWEFGSGGEVRPWLAAYPNLIVTRTLSKVWGVAGVRAGCLLAAPAMAERIRRWQLPFSPGVAVWAAFAAAASMPQLAQERAAAVVAERERQLAALAKIPGVEAVPSQGNFYLLRVPGLSGPQLAQLLGEKGVVVREVEELAAAGYVRVTVGTPAEGDVLLAACQEVCYDIAHRAS